MTRKGVPKRGGIAQTKTKMPGERRRDVLEIAMIGEKGGKEMIWNRHVEEGNIKFRFNNFCMFGTIVINVVKDY